jgi:hypothetical protein
MTSYLVGTEPSSALPFTPSLISPLEGKRIRPASRRSIGKSDILELASAQAFAKGTGRCLNFHATFRMDFSEGFDPDPREWLANQGMLFDKMRSWKERNSIPHAHLWMREIGVNNGHHVHMLVHLPPDQVGSFTEFMMKAGRFREVYPGLLPVFVTGGRNAVTTGAVSPAQQRGLLFYLTKSLPEDKKGDGVNIADTLGIRTKANSSPVLGKLCGTHRSIGKTARQEADWDDFTSLSALRAALEAGNV